eukprot:CAMPEP_0116067224 /NCGR_PEP_ID=MMETSP0322-20121206/10876_1 /TAXON_ID=163516 /ORGANISM="Leptocylindrus danicus var. apora, Strain B651" /LENGTH=319 /DNA_ID=CAMNT_0003553979 /DNA_START=216 /DNA_END=1175 /DNA_ORIENTATION=-
MSSSGLNRMVPSNCNETLSSRRNALMFQRLYSSPSDESSVVFGESEGDREQLHCRRSDLLHEELLKLGVDTEDFQRLRMASDPYTISEKGYDPHFGKSAIKTFRTFLNPKQPDSSKEMASIAAKRTAIQIDFLSRRHRSRAAEYVRCVDDERKSRRTFPLALVLDNLRSAANVGSIFRSADAAGVSEIITIGYTPRPFGSGSHKLAKSALGAENVVPTSHFANVQEAMTYLRSEGYSMIVGMETTAQSQPHTEVNYNREGKGTAVMLGNEVTGINTDIMPYLDCVVEIPMFGAKNSLNVAACAPVVLYEILRQWNYDNS